MAQRFHLRWYVWALCAASLAYIFLGRWDDAVAEGQKALRVAEEFADDSDDLLCGLGHLVGLYRQRATWAGARIWRASRPESPHAGGQDVGSGGSWPGHGAGLASHAEGLRSWPRSSRMHRAVALYHGLSFLRRFSAKVIGLAGEYDKAKQTLQELLEIAERCGMKFHIGSAHRLLGEIALTTNPPRSRHPWQRPTSSTALLSSSRSTPRTSWRWPMLATAGCTSSRDTRPGSGVSHPRPGDFERLGTLGEPDKVRQALAELPGE